MAVMPIMPFIGVRISWEMLFKNTVLDSLAIFATDRALSATSRFYISANILLSLILKIIIPILLNISRKIPYHFPMNFVQKISLIFTIIINFVMRNMMQLITGYFLFSFQISVMGFYAYFQHNNKKFRAIAIATALFFMPP